MGGNTAPDQAWPRHDGQQKTQTFEHPGHQQPDKTRRRRAHGTGRRHQQQADQQRAAQAPAVGHQAHRQTQHHAGYLHCREQKPRLHQRHTQLLLQHAHRRRQLAHVQ